MVHNDQTYGGYENGLDWITDMAIEDYQLHKKGANDGKKSKSNDSRSSNRLRNL